MRYIDPVVSVVYLILDHSGIGTRFRNLRQRTLASLTAGHAGVHLLNLQRHLKEAKLGCQQFGHSIQEVSCVRSWLDSNMSRQRSFVQTKGPDPQVVHFLNTLDGGESFHDFGVSHASGYTWEGVNSKNVIFGITEMR